MGPTIETRSRDEWLAEVKRRGGRLRRRRQLTMALVGGLAMVLPVSALSTLLGGDPGRDVSQLVAGPGPNPPAGEIAPSTGIEPGAGEMPTLPIEPAATTTTVKPPTADPVRAPADDPVVRPAPTTSVPSGSGVITMQSPLPTTTIATPAEPEPAPCVAAEFRLTVSLEKSTFKPGDTVSGSSTLENRSSGTCLMPDWWIGTRLLNGAGKDISQTARSSSSNATSVQAPNWEPCGSNVCQRPVKPGAVFTNTFSWETVDCSNPPPGPVIPVPPDGSQCVPFPAGAYTVIADWVGPGSGSPSRVTIQLGP